VFSTAVLMRGEGCRQPVSRVAVTNQMRVDTFLDAGPLSGFMACRPYDLTSDGHIRTPPLDRPRKQIRLRLHPAPVLAQGFQQAFTQVDIAVALPFPLPDMNNHALLVDIAEFQLAQLRPPQPRRVECHQDGAMHPVAGGFDECGNFAPA
jgi:hypothetical protein